MNNLLFVYGTLLDSGNEFAAYLKHNSYLYTTGKLKGKLYNIGDYPGAISSTETDDFVYGSVLQINNPETVFTVIDDYEGFGDGQPQPNEFIRVLVTIQTRTGHLNCWVYLYNLPVAGLL